MSELYIGLMSGTSVDGIDAAVVDFSKRKPVLVAHYYQPYSSDLRREIVSLCQPTLDEIHKLAELDVKLGKVFAEAVKALLKKSAMKIKHIVAIGSHGQTVRHMPERNFTLQIGDPNIIAAETGIITVADFRRRDMAFGGQGAPLVPAFHKAIFSKKNSTRAIINIGGIANVTLLTAKGKVSGFDTGPGNTLLDAWSEVNLSKPHDENGAWGAQGKINEELLKNLLNDDFFKMPAPKSTGREYFNLVWLEKYLTNYIAAVDVQTTLVELTAQSILSAIPFSNTEIFVCGGGAQNSFLMNRLKTLAKKRSVDTTEKLGVPPNWVEAMAFAWLAKQTLQKKKSNLKAVTGAKTETILGGVYFV